MKITTLLLAGLLASSTLTHASTTTLNLEGPLGGVNGWYYEKNYVVEDTLSGVGLLRGGGTNFPDNGTAYLETLGYFKLYMDSSVPNKTFDVFSVDLAEYGGLSNIQPDSVTAIGTLESGGQVQQTFVLDGIWDNSGPLADFETFVFNDSFRGLKSVEFWGNGSGSASGDYGFAFDNIVVTAVPLPAAGWLFGSAIVGIIGFKRRS